MEIAYVECRVGRRDAGEASGRRVTGEHAVVVESQPEQSLTVLVECVDVGVGAGKSRQFQGEGFPFAVEGDEPVLTACPQQRAVVDGEAPHLVGAGCVGGGARGEEGPEDGTFVAQEVDALTVVANPDVAERILEEAARVGGGDAVPLSRSDVVEADVSGRQGLWVEDADAAHLCTDPQTSVVGLSDVIDIVGKEGVGVAFLVPEGGEGALLRVEEGESVVGADPYPVIPVDEDAVDDVARQAVRVILVGEAPAGALLQVDEAHALSVVPHIEVSVAVIPAAPGGPFEVCDVAHPPGSERVAFRVEVFHPDVVVGDPDAPVGSP